MQGRYKGRFREYSGSAQGIFKKTFRDIQKGTFRREDSGKIQGASNGLLPRWLCHLYGR
jgi:hypothetical protein